MSYRIEKEGFEYRGVRLGQKCIYENKEFTIIGFDTKFINDSLFISINYNRHNSWFEHSSNVNIILDGCESSVYSWVNIDNITLLPFNTPDETLPQQISIVHIADILEDIIHEDEIIDVEKIKLVIESLREVE